MTAVDLRAERHKVITEGATAKYIIGVDEAGCGALAGPLIVVATAFAADAQAPRVVWHGLRGDKQLVAGDSKGIKSPDQRAMLATEIQRVCAAHIVIARTPQEIDARLFSTVFPEAIRLAASRCVERLSTLDPSLEPSDFLVLIDGDLTPPVIPCPVRCIADGDKLDWRIGAASVIAKARHDVAVNQLHQAFPTWCFDAHRGYPTKQHKALLAKHGPTDEHRKSFRPVMASRPRAQGIEE